MKPTPIVTIAIASALALSSNALADEGSIDAGAARKIIDGCVAHSKGKRQSHAIAVYDQGGHVVALLRMDGNPPGVAAFAQQKAEAVSYWRFSTADMTAAAKETPGFASAPHVVTVPGGIPVYSADGRHYIGAVGVSGEAPADDASCAAAGVTAAGFLLARKQP